MASSIEALLTLQAIANELSGVANIASVRGTDSAAFVYAQTGKRAIEFAPSDGAWWVEFWADDEAVDERTYVSLREAVHSSRSWLEGKDAT